MLLGWTSVLQHWRPHVLHLNLFLQHLVVHQALLKLRSFRCAVLLLVAPAVLCTSAAGVQGTAQ